MDALCIQVKRERREWRSELSRMRNFPPRDRFCKSTMAIHWLILAGSLMAAAGVARADDPEPVSEVDLQRYQGLWYEISRFPNRFQAGCTGEVTATYDLQPDGKVEVVNRCRDKDGKMKEARGVAKPAGEDLPDSRLKVRFAPAFLSFLPWVWADYWILELDPDYSYAAVGTPDQDYLWILSRNPRLDEDTYERILNRLQGQGFEVSRLVKTRQ